MALTLVALLLIVFLLVVLGLGMWIGLGLLATGALALALLDLRQELFAVLAELAKFIEFAVGARLNEAAVAQ